MYTMNNAIIMYYRGIVTNFACLMVAFTLPSLSSYFHSEGGGVGDASIRKVAYFEGAKDPSLSKGKVSSRTQPWATTMIYNDCNVM